MKKTYWIRKIRIIALSAIVTGVIIGIGYQTDLGTLCSLCPLGFLQVSLASKSIAWGMLLPVILVVGASIVLGKAFCSWICPTTWVREVFKGKKDTKINQSVHCGEGCSTCAGTGNHKKVGQYGSGFLLGALVASFIVGFPVFCLICPIGLFFGFIYAVYRVSVLYTPGWEIVIFPMIFILEIFVLRSWCQSICPLGWIFRFLGNSTKLHLKPIVKGDVCLNCQVCREACPERIDPLRGIKREMKNCNLCMECYVECPSQAIRIGLGKNSKGNPPSIPGDSSSTT